MFLWGIFIHYPYFDLDKLLQPFGVGFVGPFLRSLFDAFFQAGLPEEFSKFILLYWLVWKRKEFDQHFDGIIYAVFVSMGFALVENLMYVYHGGLTQIFQLKSITRKKCCKDKRVRYVDSFE